MDDVYEGYFDGAGGSPSAPMQFLDDTIHGAVFDPQRQYRYSLWRWWGGPRIEWHRALVAIGLNPSTADELQDDPTIRRLIGYAHDWGSQGLVMLNLFAYRATKPPELRVQADPVGPLNDQALQQVALRGGRILCCWGGDGKYQDRGIHVANLLAGHDLYALGFTKEGQPLHPLRQRKALKPVLWE